MATDHSSRPLVRSAATTQLLHTLTERHSQLQQHATMSSKSEAGLDWIKARLCEEALRRKSIQPNNLVRQRSSSIVHKDCKVHRHGSGFDTSFTTSCDILSDPSWLATFGPIGYQGFTLAPCITAEARKIALNWDPVPKTALLESMHRRGRGVRSRFRQLHSELPYSSHELAILVTEGWSRAWALLLTRLARVPLDLGGAAGATGLHLAGVEGRTSHGDDVWWEEFVDVDAAAIETALALSFCDRSSMHAYCLAAHVVGIPPQGPIENETRCSPQPGNLSVPEHSQSSIREPANSEPTFTCHRQLRWVDGTAYSMIRTMEAIGSSSESCRVATTFGIYVNDFADVCDDLTNYDVCSFKDLWPNNDSNNALWQFAAYTNWLLSGECRLSRDPFFRLSICFAWFAHLFNPRFSLSEVYESMHQRFPGFGYCCFALVPGYLLPDKWTFESPVVRPSNKPSVDVDQGRRLYFSSLATERVNKESTPSPESVSFLEWCDLAVTGGWGPQPYAIWANYALCESTGRDVGNCQGCGESMSPTIN